MLDPYTKKTVDFRYAGTTLQFAVAQGLFSSHQVDIGTQHLLKSLVDIDLSHARKILDLGCGYGPLGLALAQLAPDSEIHLVDRDALAVLFAEHNGALNNIPNVRAYGSLGYDDVVEQDFDVVVSNIPGKAGESVIRSLLLRAERVVSTNGLVAVVVVSPLEELVEKTLSGPGIETLLHRTTAAHAIFHYRFTGEQDTSDIPSSWDDGLYDRATISFILDENTLPLRTMRGLPEFDTLSYATILACKALQEPILQDLDDGEAERLCVFNPGQGIVPVLLWQRFAPQQLDLVGRDLLALRTTRQNLIDNGCSENAIRLHHDTSFVPENSYPTLVVGTLRDDEGPDAVEHALVTAATRLKRGYRILVVGRSTPITRLIKSKDVGRHLRTLKRKRGKGNSTALFVRK
ncbi:MAG: class I SAM-dependent methyltransferase [Anaerolineae bacterium]|nr:class I SAM-dependent methyltransferase [Anaerolineae bacterium]